jgi:hypothetical protein
MKRQHGYTHAFEQIIADGLTQVASELRLVELPEILTLIRNGQNLNIADIVNSSSELHFVSGTLSYARHADYVVHWDGSPAISIDLEFRQPPVQIFFRLHIRQQKAAVEILHDRFECEEQDAGERVRLLNEAMALARLPAPSAPRGGAAPS